MNAHLKPASTGDVRQYDLLDQEGRLLLIGVTDRVANQVADQLSNLPGWSSGFRIRSQRARRPDHELLWDWRHEGPLELLVYSSDVKASAAVQVRSHVGRCGLDLEEAARRLGQFTQQHQTVLLAMMAERFGFDLAEWQTYRQGEHA